MHTRTLLGGLLAASLLACGSSDDSTTVDASTPDASVPQPAAADSATGADVADVSVGVDAGCSSPSECPAAPDDCSTATCNASHACGVAPVALGSPCKSSGGTVCNGAGVCVSMHCADGVRDADETDVDCGGSCGATCKDTQKCGMGTDCVSRVCDAMAKTCSAPSCADGVRNGAETDVDCGGMCNGCSNGLKCLINNDCASGLCNNGVCATLATGQACALDKQCQSGSCAGGYCCNVVCNGTCKSCSQLFTGKPNGTCADVSQGSPAPAGQCTVTTTCGNDGKCALGAVCEKAFANTACSVCANGQIASASKCDGAGTCNAGTFSACANHLACADSASCATACGTNDAKGDGSCSPTSVNGGNGNYWCDGMGQGACQPTQAKGATCNRDSQCQSGSCVASACN